MVAQDVADVLAQEALDALAELAHAVDVLLADRPLGVGRRRERRDPLVDLVVPAHVGDEVADDRERVQRLDADRLVLGQVVEPRLAHQPRPAVDLGAARAALRGLAVPAHGEVRRLAALDLEHRVEHDHAGLGLDLVVDELAAGGVASPQAQRARAHAALGLLARVDQRGERRRLDDRARLHRTCRPASCARRCCARPSTSS